MRLTRVSKASLLGVPALLLLGFSCNSIAAEPDVPPTEITQVQSAESDADAPAPEIGSLKTLQVTPIDLSTALSLVDVQNPEFLLSQQRVVEAVALRKLAAAQILPTINLGTSYDGHVGNLQQSNGNILQVNRNSLFIGAGASAIAAGTVNIPGVVWSLNVSDSIFSYLASRQVVAQRRYASEAARNEIGLRVVVSYLELLQAEGARSIGLQVRSEAAEAAIITAAYAKAGQGRQADAERAATELHDRDALVIEFEGEAFRASARLAQLLGLETSIRLHPTDNWVVPHSFVPDAIELPELLAIAMLQRPELKERQAVIAEALLRLEAAKMLPFSPTTLIGFSAGSFGGGSNLITAPTGSTQFGRDEPRFGSFAARTDLDVLAFWTLRNLGVGNKAQIDAARSRVRTADLEWTLRLDRVRAEVANAFIRTHAKFAKIQSAEKAALAAKDSWEEDLRRIRGKEGVPIELLNSLRLLARARQEYLKSIIEYNRAQFELYVALGQPPADLLARPAEAE